MVVPKYRLTPPTSMTAVRSNWRPAVTLKSACSTTFAHGPGHPAGGAYESGKGEKPMKSWFVKSGTTLECSGVASRAGLDRHVGNAVREAWEKERLFPQGVVNNLRPFFNEAGLHFFKHRKRVLHVSSIKPVRHPEKQPFSDGITAILKTVEGQPRIKRPQLAAKILGEGHELPEAAPKKEALAADLHYLLHIGHVIEFADGSFDLPLSPKGETPPPQQQPKSGGGKPPNAVPETAAVPGTTEVPEESLVDPNEGSEVHEEALPEAAPPAEEEPVPGEEEGEAEPSEGAAHLPESSAEPEAVVSEAAAEAEPTPVAVAAPVAASPEEPLPPA